VRAKGVLGLRCWNRFRGAGRASETLAAQVLAGSLADFGKFIAEETEKWAKVIRAAHIKVE
jgi:hypothetical protein